MRPIPEKQMRAIEFNITQTAKAYVIVGKRNRVSSMAVIILLFLCARVLTHGGCICVHQGGHNGKTAHLHQVGERGLGAPLSLVAPEIEKSTERAGNESITSPSFPGNTRGDTIRCFYRVLCFVFCVVTLSTSSVIFGLGGRLAADIERPPFSYRAPITVLPMIFRNFGKECGCIFFVPEIF